MLLNKSKKYDGGHHRYKIVLICGNRQRELSMLKLLKKEIEQSLMADVWIIGSIADIQRIYYLLNRIKPEMVFISQIVEKVTRDIAYYVKKSGAILCVLPVEFTFSKSDYDQIFNRIQKYDKYLDYYFLTGPRMYRAAKKLSDINEKKMFITGTPKIDLYKNKNADRVFSRREFVNKYSIPRNRKNIFVFTSFVLNSIDYIKSQKVFRGKVNQLIKWNKRMLSTRSVYIKDVAKLCRDFPDCNIIIKPHPLEDAALYEAIDNKNFYLIDDIPFNDVVKSIDLAIYWHSTVATECWITGTKVVQYKPVTKFDELQSDFAKGNPSYSEYEHLKSGVSNYLVHKLEKRYLDYQKKYLELCYYKIDGLATKRIVNLVKKFLKEGRNNSLSYKFQAHTMFSIFLLFEKIFGVKPTRKIVSLILKDYNWGYAAENFVFIGPTNQ